MDVKRSGSFPYLKAAAKPRKKPNLEESKTEAKKLSSKDKVSLTKYKRTEHLVSRVKDSYSSPKIARRSSKKKSNYLLFPIEQLSCITGILTLACGHLGFALGSVFEKVLLIQ
jgi:hypothetical protein